MYLLLTWGKSSMWHSWMFSCSCASSCIRESCPSQSEVWDFLHWGLCTCTSSLFGIPHLSSLLLPCFRPYAWLTCPSRSDMLITTPPWNHQLHSSDLPGPVCFTMKLQAGSYPIHLCLMHLQCRVMVSFPPRDVPCRYSWSEDPLICWQLGEVRKVAQVLCCCANCTPFKGALLVCMRSTRSIWLSSPSCDSVYQQEETGWDVISAFWNSEWVVGWWTNTLSHFEWQSSLPLQWFWAVIAMCMGVWAGYPSVDLIYGHMTSSRLL